MREAAFIQRNKARWERLERAGEHLRTLHADEASELYIQLTDDLSYARTFYPQSNVHTYLNGLAGQVHRHIYRNKAQEKGRFLSFWTREVPLAMAGTRPQLLLSFGIFLLACVIGAVSAAHDDTFVRLILGDDYVDTTISNIEQGRPMAIYGSAEEMDMFLAITVNNIRVSLLAFAAGLFFSFGTGYLLVTNGIMLGSFQYFFHQHGVLAESVLSIWVHGTLEISAIIIAGAAGFTLGKGFLFPGTYTRIESFMRNARTGLRIVIGLVPVFILAGFLESFVTRLAPALPAWASIGIIVSSLAFIVYYFILHPYHVEHRSRAVASST